MIASIDIGMAVVNGLMTKIQGRCNLPPGYFLVTVPGDATFQNDQAWTPWKIPFQHKPDRITMGSIAASNNIPQAVAAVIQAVFATITLYLSYGHQIDRFGYAAFGLTVVPYVVMSVLNLVANVVCPTYAAMYLVSNKTLRDLQANSPDNGLEVDSVVGTLSDTSDEKMRKTLLQSQSASGPESYGVDLSQLKFRHEYGIFQTWSFLVIVGVDLGIIGGLSKFKSNASTISERIWTMTWLAFGVMIGWMTAYDVERWESRRVLNMGETEHNRNVWLRTLEDVFFFCFFGVGAIGGFVVVAKMILSYGVCSVV